MGLGCKACIRLLHGAPLQYFSPLKVQANGPACCLAFQTPLFRNCVVLPFLSQISVGGWEVALETWTQMSGDSATLGGFLRISQQCSSQFLSVSHFSPAGILGVDCDTKLTKACRPVSALFKTLYSYFIFTHLLLPLLPPLYIGVLRANFLLVLNCNISLISVKNNSPLHFSSIFIFFSINNNLMLLLLMHSMSI